MAKRPRPNQAEEEEDDDDNAARRRRLYVTVHDYKRGSTVYKLDADAFESESDSDLPSGLDRRARRLPRRRAVARLAAPDRLRSHLQFVSAGRKIFAFHGNTSGSTLVYDLAKSSRRVAICPPLLAPKASAEFLVVGRDIYALETDYTREWEEEEAEAGWSRSGDVPSLEKLGPAPRGGWGQWKWESLPPPPFKLPFSIQCHTLHPDGSTWFLSVASQDVTGTFSFDAERRRWTRRGRWLMPFDGKAYLVRELDAWVGLCSHRKGYLAVCQVDDVTSRGGPPVTRVEVEGRVYNSWWKRHVRASLTYMGNAQFCVAETMTRKSDIFTETRRRMMLRLATFRVERDCCAGGGGQLRAVNMRTILYKLPRRECEERRPTAFSI